MKNNNDFEFISKKFEEENINAPEALNAESIKEKLDGDAKIIKLKKKNSVLKSTVAIAACFAVIAVSVSFLNFGKTFKPVLPTPAGADIEGIVTFKSYNELEDALEEAQKDSEGGSYYLKNFDGIMSEKAGSVADDGNAVGMGGENNTGTGGSLSFASTNKQVDAVDEADIIKTDGKYIYYIGEGNRSEIRIFSADNGKTELVSRISQPEKELYFSEMFVYGDKLLAVGNRNEFTQTKTKEEDEDADGSELRNGVYYNYFRGNVYSIIYTYDISNREKPELTDKYEQSGYYISSRMIDSCVYLVSKYDNRYYGIKDDSVPCATGDEGKTEKLHIEDICSIEGTKSSCYSIIGAVDVESKKNAKKTKAVLGVNNEIYCNENNLYVTGTNYKDDTEYTRIVKYSLDETDIKLTATGNLKGSVNDQFSMDEKDGNLRIALTDYRWGEGKDKNYLYVLNGDLDLLGKTEGFAKNEHIEAVRFIGDTAYVITYEQTDPLFIIDLSNPSEPKITGEVKISGFSSFLTPVDENTMLGIGFATSEEEWGIVQDGLKLALFDVSDKNAPKVLASYEMREAYSPAQYRHKALTVNPEENYWAIPYEDYNGGQGVLIIRIENGKLLVNKETVKEAIQRCTYIGRYIYAPAHFEETVYSFEVK